MTITDHQDRPNWVDERGRCTLSSKFDEVIEAVRYDVEQVNKIVQGVRHGQLFAVKECREGYVQVCRYSETRPNDSSGYVTFKLCKRKIVVHLPGEITFDVIPRWNEEEIRCELLIDGKPQELWSISQKVLGGFFFDSKE